MKDKPQKSKKGRKKKAFYKMVKMLAHYKETTLKNSKIQTIFDQKFNQTIPKKKKKLVFSRLL